jgi:hypothetical protein
VLHRVKEERNVLYTIKRRKANLIGHILRRDCLLRYIIRGKVGRNRSQTKKRRGKQLLDDLKERRGCYKVER